MDPERLHAATFAPHRGEAFHVVEEAVDVASAAVPPAGQEIVALELIEVTERPAPASQEVFSVLFRGPRSPELPQRFYGLRHPKLGSFGLFLVPVGPDREGFPLYEALFNRLGKE